LYKSLAQRQVELFKSKADNEGIVKDVFVWIAVTIPTSKFDEVTIDEMVKRRSMLKSTFRSIGFPTQDVNADDLLVVLRHFFGWDDSLGWEDDVRTEIHPYDSLSRQILPGDFTMDCKQDSLIFVREEGDDAIVTLEPIRRPKTWSLPMMSLFLGDDMVRGESIRAEFMISFGLIVLPKQNMERSAAIAKRETLGKNLKSGFLKWMPGLEEEYHDIDEALGFLQSGERMVSIFQNVILKDKAHIIKQRVSEYRSMMRRKGFEFVPCDNDHANVLLASLPMHLVEEERGGLLGLARVAGLGLDLRSIGRGIRSTCSGEARALLPIVGEWKGDGSPGLPLVGRLGQIMAWSPFGGVLVPSKGQMPVANENFNCCIAGVSGSGKSVFMQAMLLSVMGVGGQGFILDYGRSFKRVCQNMGGTHIEFDIRNPISLNPFPELSSKLEDIEETEDALASIATILSTMAAPIQGTSDLQNALLQKAMRNCWNEKKQDMEVTDIADWLLAQKDESSQELGSMLFPFTKDGVYGKFFTGKPQLSLHNKLVVLETDYLRNTPGLLAVVVQMIAVHINQVVTRSKRRWPIMLFLEECWKLLEGKATARFVTEWQRVARKYWLSIVMATQNLTDYFRPESPGAEIAFENCSWKVILKQNSDTLESLRYNPKLAAFVKEDWQLELLQSVHSSPPHYSEAAIFGPDIKGVIGRLMLDPFTKLLTSTNAEDYQALENKVNRGMSIPAAIEDILSTRGLL
jgi:conjugal transfer ATP-binding protein TraC